MEDKNFETPAGRKRRASSGHSTQARKTSKKASTSRKGRFNGEGKKKMDEMDLASLPDNVLLRIFVKAGYKARLSAMQVCKRFHHIATHPRFTRRVKDGKIMETVKKAKAGDTIIIPPGLYDEMVLFEKPVKVVGEMTEQVFGGTRRSVVLQSSRSICVLCNARCAFENVVFRTGIATTDRSVCSFGPACDYMRFDNCEFGGFNGLYLPRSAMDNARLTLFGCRIHGVAAPLHGVSVEKGCLRMEGCTITNCQYGVDSHPDSIVYLKNNEISFNEFAMLLSGRGVVFNNVFWGNVKRSAVELSIDNLLEVNTDNAEAVPSFKEMMQDFAQKDAEASQNLARDPPPRVPLLEGNAGVQAEPGQPGNEAAGAGAPPQGAPGDNNPQGGDNEAPAAQAEDADRDNLAQQAARLARNPDRQFMEVMRRRMAGDMHVVLGRPAFTNSIEDEALDLPKRIHIVGNQLKFAGQKRERPEEEAAVRRRVRQLAAMTYGAHEHGWHDDNIADSEEDWTDEEEVGFEDDDVDGEDDDDDFEDPGEWEGIPIDHDEDEDEDDDDSDTDSEEDDEIDEWDWDEDVGGWGDDSDLEDDHSQGMVHTDDDLSSLEDAMDVAQPEDLPNPNEDGEENEDAD